MNKPFKSSVILLILAIASLCFFFKIPIQQVRATYIWGPIKQDTVWTLVDSPFVVSGDIVIYPGATLTIEPAVEVRFGGNFSIIVEGALMAEGMGAANVKFTSNGLNPNPGDWGTILLNDTDSIASLSNCTIEYATNGTQLDTGSLTIENSQVRFSSQNGFAAANGIADINNNIFENNTESGIYIEGNNQALIHNNNFTLNADGVTLAGNLNPNANITQNFFFNNTHSGISLVANPISNALISENTFSGNNYGFDVATDASTNIANNTIRNNTVGIMYETGNTHQAHFNDIYNNTIGMDVTGNATVDAQYNYWGDRSGPEHDHLNPYGKGNPVGGDGTNLNFIFFLTHPFEYSNSPPTAILETDKTLVTLNQNVTLIGTSSHDDGQVDQYLFDFGDGNSTDWTTLSMFNYSYASPGTRTLSLEVKDDFNATSQNPATINITVQQNLTPLDISLNLSNETVNLDTNVSATVYVSNGAGPVGNANVRLLSVNGGSFTPISGLTDSSGYFTTVFTAPNVAEVTNVRVIATASMSGYADGSDYGYVEVLPPLNVQIKPQLTTVNSEDNITVLASVTDSFGQPVSGADLTMSVDQGTLSTTHWMTDSNGTASFTFTAPQTLSQINATLAVAANKTGYAAGQGQQVITINPKLLVLGVTANPPVIISESTSQITVHTTWNTTPISNATLTASSSIGGNFSSFEQTTDSNGNAIFVFTAPQITAHNGAQTNITIDAYKIGYVNAEQQVVIAIVPKLLVVQITVQPSLLTSATEANVTVHVTSSSDSNQVSEANVTITSENGGNFSATTGLTDRNGNITFALTAPAVNAPLNVTVSALAQKAGFAFGQGFLPITVNPGNLTVQVEPSAPTVSSGETSVIRVFVTGDSAPIANASVTMSSNYGNFSTKIAVTDSNGTCSFLFNAPNTTVQLTAEMMAMANKNGYWNSMNQTTINVIPKMSSQTVGGWPMIVILLIIIPIIIAVIVVVLVKLKVLSISFKEEE